MTTEPCLRPGCGGTIDDGYCTVCGLAPESRPSAVLTAPAPVDERRSSGVSLAAVPAAEPIDPRSMLIAPTVPDGRRRCQTCGGQLRDERGTCAKCGRPFDFAPPLAAGALVAGRHEVAGTVGLGAAGWVYAARDTALDRWVVLKTEPEAPVAITHPNIVTVYDRVVHGPQTFTVLELVAGKSLLQLRRDHAGPLDPLVACTYILEVLPAFDALAAAGLVYCDFKLENAIAVGDTVKLIDLGAVRTVDGDGDVYGTRGYTAPEGATAPSTASDLYTVGRALAILVADFDYQGEFEHALPDSLAAHPMLGRFLVKATRDDPSRRFQTAGRMAQQLRGVIRHITRSGHAESTYFAAPDGDHPALPTVLAAVDGQLRVEWDAGAAALARGDGAAAAAAFARVLDELPGELGPLLGLALALEAAGDLEQAGAYFDLVTAIEPAWAPAAFGAHRCRAALLARSGNRAGVEAEYRECARLASTRQERARWIDKANQARPFRLV